MEDLESLLAHLPVSLPARDNLRARLCAADRHYHGAAHVALLWQRHRRFGAGLWVTSEPWDTRIACAIAFHDAIYDARRQDNEALSAALWRTVARHVDTDTVEWVAGTIEATADHLMVKPDSGMAPDALEARAWVLDLDLTPLGETADVFAANTQLLRREHAHLTATVWEEGRLAFLSRFASAPRLFRSPALAQTFEKPARLNIAAALRGRR